MSILRRLDRMERELDEYMNSKGKRKQVFALWRKLAEIDRSDPDNEDEFFDVFTEILTVGGSETLKRKMRLNE